METTVLLALLGGAYLLTPAAVVLLGYRFVKSRRKLIALAIGIPVLPATFVIASDAYQAQFQPTAATGYISVGGLMLLPFLLAIWWSFAAFAYFWISTPSHPEP